MGNLVTKGMAKRVYEAERMKLTIIFQKEGDERGISDEGKIHGIKSRTVVLAERKSI